MDKENKLYVDGQEIGVAQLAAVLQERLGDSVAGKRVVLLKVHQEILAQRFEPVIEAISEAGGDLAHIVEDEKKK